MRKNITKIILLLITITLLTSCLIGCVDKNKRTFVFNINKNLSVSAKIQKDKNISIVSKDDGTFEVYQKNEEDVAEVIATGYFSIFDETSWVSLKEKIVSNSSDVILDGKEDKDKLYAYYKDIQKYIYCYKLPNSKVCVCITSPSNINLNTIISEISFSIN